MTAMQTRCNHQWPLQGKGQHAALVLPLRSNGGSAKRNTGQVKTTSERRHNGRVPQIEADSTCKCHASHSVHHSAGVTLPCQTGVVAVTDQVKCCCCFKPQASIKLKAAAIPS
jgi:hypothetical protein